MRSPARLDLCARTCIFRILHPVRDIDTLCIQRILLQINHQLHIGKCINEKVQTYAIYNSIVWKAQNDNLLLETKIHNTHSSQIILVPCMVQFTRKKNIAGKASLVYLLRHYCTAGILLYEDKGYLTKLADSKLKPSKLMQRDHSLLLASSIQLSSYSMHSTTFLSCSISVQYCCSLCMLI